jgi:hypothetical protein
MQICNTLNPASLFFFELINEHLCEEIISQTIASRLDLTDKPLEKPDAQWLQMGLAWYYMGCKRHAIQ